MTIPNEDTLNFPAILAKQRARIADLEAALMASFNANDLLLEQRDEARAACDALAANVDRIAAQRDDARRAFEATTATLGDVARYRDELLAVGDGFVPIIDSIAEQRDQAIRDFDAESVVLVDMTRQRDALLRAVKEWRDRKYSEHIGNKLTDALTYCEQLTPADRARDAQEQAGRQAAEDEAKKLSSQLWDEVKEIPY